MTMESGIWGALRERINERRRSETMTLHDHSSPWVCGEPGCVVCDHKPSYHAYMNARRLAGG